MKGRTFSMPRALVFRQINLIGFGIQVELFRERVSDVQLGIFCLAGPAAAIVAGYMLALAARWIVKCRSLLFRAIAYYASLVLLMVDPLYLSFLYSFVGGGDMNGIALIFPETAVRILFGAMAAIHAFLLFKHLLPIYRKAYEA